MRRSRTRLALAAGLIAGCLICPTTPFAQRDADGRTLFEHQKNPKTELTADEAAAANVAAKAAEAKGDYVSALRFYRHLARSGDGNAAVRVGDMYEKGRPGIAPDHQEALMWYQKARDNGVDVRTPRK